MICLCYIGAILTRDWDGMIDFLQFSFIAAFCSDLCHQAHYGFKLSFPGLCISILKILQV